MIRANESLIQITPCTQTTILFCTSHTKGRGLRKPRRNDVNLLHYIFLKDLRSKEWTFKNKPWKGNFITEVKWILHLKLGKESWIKLVKQWVYSFVVCCCFYATDWIAQTVLDLIKFNSMGDYSYLTLVKSYVSWLSFQKSLFASLLFPLVLPTCLGAICIGSVLCMCVCLVSSRRKDYVNLEEKTNMLCAFLSSLIVVCSRSCGV